MHCGIEERMSATENLTVMFTDIAGFTEKTAKLSRQQHKQLLSDHDRLLLPVIKHFGGKKIKSVGDGMLISFRSPTDAVKCAMAMQDQMYGYNQNRDEIERIDIRAALNAGEVQIERGDIFGDAVNLASRLEGITPPGEIFFTQAVYLAMHKAEVPHVEVGKENFKGVDQAVEIFKVRKSIEDGSAAPYDSDLSFTNSILSGLRSSDSASSSGGGKKLLAVIAVAVVLVVTYFLLQSFRGDPTDIVNLKEQSQAMLDANQLAEAQSLAEDHVTSNPEDAEGLILMGHVQIASGEIDEALHSYRRSVELEATLIEDEKLVTNVLGVLGENESANLFVIENPTQAFIDGLFQASVTPGWEKRRNAIKMLKKLSMHEKIDWVEVTLADLQEQTGCEEKLKSIQTLRKLRNKRSLSALKKLVDVSLIEKVKSNCYRSELKKTIAEIEGGSSMQSTTNGRLPESDDIPSSGSGGLSKLMDKLKSVGAVSGEVTEVEGSDK
ncbi:MAG: class 3 adenylate cyclase [Parasphingorhabdus sp.]|jgi:class 3 adenylate cyclase